MYAMEHRFTDIAGTSFAAPALPLLLREAGSFATMRAKASFAKPVETGVVGDRRNVIILPGFLASDVSTARLRKSLSASGFQTHGWGLGRNLGVKRDILEKLDARLDALNLDGPATLVGWSLGGVIAREFAKYSPHRIDKVITLGSPFSGSLRANNAWRLYEFIAGHAVDSPPIDAVTNEKPPVTTIAMWSGRDGVVSPHSARGNHGESDAHVELTCAHMGFVSDPAAIRSICKAIMS